jgi:hypothetical protein
MNYAQQHLIEAVSVLVSYEDRIKDRLQYAARYFLKTEMNLDELPAPLQAEYTALAREAYGAVEDDDRGSINATIHSLSDADASRLADRMFGLLLHSFGHD